MSANTTLRSINILDVVELAEISGVGACSGEGVVAVRVDRPRVGTNDVEHEWVVIDWPTMSVILEASAGDSIVDTLGFYEPVKPRWSLDCDWMYFRALHDGEVQIWGLNIPTGVQQQITNDEGNILFFHLSPDGGSIVYEADISRDSIKAAEKVLYEGGAIVDASMYPAAPLFNSLPLHGAWRAMRVWGGFRLPEHLLSQEPKRHRVLSVGDRVIRDANESEIAEMQRRRSGITSWMTEESASANWWYPTGFRSAVLSSTRQTAAVSVLSESADGVRNRTGIARVSEEDPSKLERCEDKRCFAKFILPINWSLDDNTVYFIAQDGVYWGATLFSWAPSTSSVQEVARYDGTLGALASGWDTRSMPCPVIDATAFCTMSSHDTPPQLAAIDLSTGTHQVVYSPNHQLHDRFLLSAKRILWTDRFNREHNGILVLPKGYEQDRRYPLILTTYACPGFLKGGIADGGPEYPLAEHGFVVLCVNSNSDDPPAEVTSKESIGPARYVAALAEYESAIEILVDKGIADPGRVGATGMSFSSQAISFALTHSDLFHAVALTNAGVYEPSWETRQFPGSGYTQYILDFHKIGPDQYSRSEIYEDISLSLRADRVSSAVLIQASDRESVFSFGAFFRLLEANKPAEMHVFPDETHAFHQPVHRYVNFTRNVDWFRFWLQNYEDPDPGKAGQYERWRKLRLKHCSNLKVEGRSHLPVYCEAA